VLTTLLAGLGSGLSLIVAIGAQNAFVLRQGIRREHVGPVALLCALADALLIAAGVLGIGTLVERAPAVLDVVRWGGVAFLLCYAALALHRAVHPEVLRAGESRDGVSLGAALTTAAALTFLNPHVYLDTVLLLGSIANQHGDDGRWVFAAGAALGSFAWFFGLGYGARRLAPLFANVVAWRVLDALIALVMTVIALSLALG
jgi:L-lysine exporter family protein LysE/ArgO